MDDVEEALQKFREEFLRASRERAGEMESLLASLRARPADPVLLGPLERHFHGLVGTGGTYGYPRVSELAAQGEIDCRSVLEAQGAAAPEQLERWAALVKEIRRALEGAGS